MWRPENENGRLKSTKICMVRFMFIRSIFVFASGRSVGCSYCFPDADISFKNGEKLLQWVLAMYISFLKKSSVSSGGRKEKITSSFGHYILWINLLRHLVVGKEKHDFKEIQSIYPTWINLLPYLVVGKEKHDFKELQPIYPMWINLLRYLVVGKEKHDFKEIQPIYPMWINLLCHLVIRKEKPDFKEIQPIYPMWINLICLLVREEGKWKSNTTLTTITKSTPKIVERGKIDHFNTQIHDRSLSWLDTIQYNTISFI